MILRFFYTRTNHPNTTLQINMIFVLLIEDDPNRVKRFNVAAPQGVRIIHARSAGVALGVLRRDQYAGILLDHDLGKAAITVEDRSLSGTDLIETIATTQNRGIPILIHSVSHQGSSIMAKKLEAGGFDVTRCPFPEITDQILQEWFSKIGDEERM